MKRREFLETAAAALATARASLAQGQDADVVLRAMLEEMGRSKMLKIAALDLPYFFEYALDDVEALVVQASLGGLMQSRRYRMRVPRVQVRVGDYGFDNTNHVFSDYYGGSRFDADQWPLDDNYEAIRTQLWLATDRAFKAASEAIARKRATLKNLNQAEKIPDFSKADPVRITQPSNRLPLDENQWAGRARKLSAVFSGFPKILGSSLEFEATETISYLVNSEGTALRVPDTLAYWRARASGLAADGGNVRDGLQLFATSLQRIPSDAEVERALREMATNITALTDAPLGESYAGPVLFDGMAAAQLFAEVLGPHLALSRRPLADPGHPMPYLASELEGRVGSRILPDFIDVMDDPTQRDWRGRALLGYTPYDMEGVVPGPLTLVEKGKLKDYLLTRTPVATYTKSNGRARLPGSFGAKLAVLSNLFVTARETVSPASLKKQLLDLVAQRQKKYGYIVRKMDYPSSASIGEIRAIAQAAMQQGAGARLVSSPILLYRAYPDGKEELVRGLRFRGLSVRSLKDILAASDQQHFLDYMYTPAPFSLMGAGGYVAPATVIAPSVLFEDLELEPSREEVQRPPVVPPPPLT